MKDKLKSEIQSGNLDGANIYNYFKTRHNITTGCNELNLNYLAGFCKTLSTPYLENNKDNYLIKSIKERDLELFSKHANYTILKGLPLIMDFVKEILDPIIETKNLTYANNKEIR